MYHNKTFYLIFTLCLLLFPILDINFAFNYLCETNCSTIDLSLKEWLYFKSIIMVGNTLLMLLFLYSQKRTLIRKLYFIILIFFQILIGSFIINGNIIFFRNLNDLQNVKDYLYFSIISGYFYVIIIFLYIYIEREFKKDKPLIIDYDIL
jgi:hypothetical protein